LNAQSVLPLLGIIGAGGLGYQILLSLQSLLRANVDALIALVLVAAPSLECYAASSSGCSSPGFERPLPTQRQMPFSGVIQW